MSESRIVHGAEAERWMPEGWSWAEPRHGEHFRRCNYCGSIHPEDLVAEPHWHADWADYKYGWPHKFYVSIPDRRGGLHWLGGTSGGKPQSIEKLHAQGYKTPGELTDEEREACKAENVDLTSYQGVRVGKRDNHFGKFYSIHLADPAIDQEVKEKIYRGSGLRFTFLEDGKVRWEPYNYE